jgi:hypothetical protein
MKCLRGASALAEEMDKAGRGGLRAFVVWEPVLASDWGPPDTAALARMAGPGVMQFWDRPHALSTAIRSAGDDRVLGGRRLKNPIVWDYVAVFEPGLRWEDRYPVPVYAGAPVLDIVEEFRPYLR